MISVILADDNALIRKTIAKLLNSDPEVELLAETTNYSQTMELLSALHPQIVIMDLHMGDENKVTPSQVKSRLGGSRLLAISIWNDDETKALAESFGAVTLLDKPSLGSELIPAIKRFANDCGTGFAMGEPGPK